MSEGKWYEFFKNIKKEKYTKIRKIISTILLILIIIGSAITVAFNLLVCASLYGIKVETEDFEVNHPNNYTISLEGKITIKNEHWYSVDISNIKIDFKIIANDIEIIEDSFEKDKIPRLKTSEIEIAYLFDLYTLYESYIALNYAEELLIEISGSFYYAIYKISFEIELEVEEI